jgi:branched-chain amino acid transport system permease protein
VTRSAQHAEQEISAAFARRQREHLARLVTPELIAEHAARPIGDPSPALALVLAAMRQSPTAGKLALLETSVEREWAIVRLSGEPGTPHDSTDPERYTTRDAALHAVFLRRLAEMGLPGTEGGPQQHGLPGTEGGPQQHGLPGTEGGPQQHGLPGTEGGPQQHGLPGPEGGTR